MEKFYNSLTLLFLSRQGYWSDLKEVKDNSLVQLIYKYILASLALFPVLGIAGKEIIKTLQTYTIHGILTYFELLVFLLPLILVAGVVYENIYTFTMKTLSTLRVFFNISEKELFILLLVKNIIIVSPILIIISYYQFYLGIISLLLITILNFIVYLPKISCLKFGIKFNLNLGYIMSVIDVLTFIKVWLTPLCSVVIFMLTFVFLPQFLSFDKFSSNELLMASLFYGTIFFGSRGMNFYFLALNKDIPYLRAIQIDTKKFITKNFVSISIINFILPVTAISIFLHVMGYSLPEIILFLIGMVCAYLLCQSVQLLEVVVFKQYNFKNAKELDAFSIPIRIRVILYFIRIIPLFSYLILNQIHFLDFSFLLFSNIVFTIFIFYTIYNFVVSKLSKGVQHVYFID